jgi:hypothetical protein
LLRQNCGMMQERAGLVNSCADRENRTSLHFLSLLSKRS